MDQKNVNPHFISIITSISYAAWQGLGKIPNPMTNKIEKNLDSARLSIDMLEMMKEKTKGNLTADEQKFLDNTVSDLQLNYIDVSKTVSEEKLKEGEKKDGKAEDNKEQDKKEEKK